MSYLPNEFHNNWPEFLRYSVNDKRNEPEVEEDQEKKIKKRSRGEKRFEKQGLQCPSEMPHKKVPIGPGKEFDVSLLG